MQEDEQEHEVTSGVPWVAVLAGSAGLILFLTGLMGVTAFLLVSLRQPAPPPEPITPSMVVPPLPPPPAPPPSPSPADPPFTYSEQLDLVVNRLPGSGHPAVVYFHDGGWDSGEHVERAWLREKLCAVGFTVVDVHYRAAPEHAYPAAVDDARLAITTVVARADQWGIDPDRVAALGAWSGGYVALMASLDDEVPVRAAVALYAPTDLTLPDYRAGHATLWTFLHGASPLEASPLSRVTPVDPPTWFIVGASDGRVSVADNRITQHALEEVGVTARLVVYEGAGSGFLDVEAYRDRTLTDVVAFLREQMGDAPGR